MCFPEKCATCELTTWGGCGRHLPSIFQKIPKGQACMCKDWPGVKVPKEAAEEAAEEEKPEGKGTSATVAVAQT